VTILLFTINPGLEIVGQLPAGTVGDSYSATVSVRGGLSPYTLTVVSALPGGLTATDNGNGTLTIAGTPTETFAGTVTIRARDGLQKLVQRAIGLQIGEITAPPTFLLLETGDFLLLESGDKIQIED
jgi:hypothetical protein